MRWNGFFHASSSCSSCSDVLQTSETFGVPHLLRSFLCFFTWIAFLSFVMCLFVGERNSKNSNWKSAWARLVGKEEGLLRTATEMTSETKKLWSPSLFFSSTVQMILVSLVADVVFCGKKDGRQLAGKRDERPVVVQLLLGPDSLRLPPKLLGPQDGGDAPP